MFIVGKTSLVRNVILHDKMRGRNLNLSNSVDPAYPPGIKVYMYAKRDFPLELF